MSILLNRVWLNVGTPHPVRQSMHFGLASLHLFLSAGTDVVARSFNYISLDMLGTDRTGSSGRSDKSRNPVCRIIIRSGINQTTTVCVLWYIGIDFGLEFRIISQEDFIMKLKNTAQNILSGLVFIVGFYMVIKFASVALAPVLSGIAFMIIGFLFLLKK